MSANVSTGSMLNVSVSTSSLRLPIRVAAVLLAAALTAAAAQFTLPLPFTVVPFTLTPFVVMLTGAALGARLGCLAQVVYLVAGAIGLQVFAPSAALPPGVARLVGPTAGYLWAYPIAAFVTGWLAERGWDRRYLSSLASMITGLLIIFAGGVSWLSVFLNSLPTAIDSGFTPFIVMDLGKAAVAALVLPQAWRLVGLGKRD
jgi:biotin transport system substrate-specific component